MRAVRRWLSSSARPSAGQVLAGQSLPASACAVSATSASREAMSKIIKYRLDNLLVVDGGRVAGVVVRCVCARSRVSRRVTYYEGSASAARRLPLRSLWGVS